MEDPWNRLQAVLALKFPGVAEGSLRAGATPDQILAVERQVGVVFPPDLREAYLHFDGVAVDSNFKLRGWPRIPKLIVGGCDWVRLEYVATIWQEYREVMASLRPEIGDAGEPRPEWKIRDAGWIDPLWIPVGYGYDGKYAACDMHPAPAGVLGQLISTSPGGGDEAVLATSFKSYFSSFVKALEDDLLVAKGEWWADQTGNYVATLEQVGA